MGGAESRGTAGTVGAPPDTRIARERRDCATGRDLLDRVVLIIGDAGVAGGIGTNAERTPERCTCAGLISGPGRRCSAGKGRHIQINALVKSDTAVAVQHLFRRLVCCLFSPRAFVRLRAAESRRRSPGFRSATRSLLGSYRRS